MTCHRGCACAGCGPSSQRPTLGSFVQDLRHGFAAEVSPLELKCTGRYKSLITTGHGATIDDMCPTTGPDYCNDVDVAAWVNLSRELKARVRTAWNDTANSGVQIPAQVEEYVTAVDKEFCDSDEDWVCTVYHLEPTHMTANPVNVGLNAAAITKIIKWCTRAVCALEILDNVRGQVGPIEPQPSPAPPGPFPNFPQLPIPSMGSVVWIGIGLLALWLLARRRAAA